MIIRFKIFGTSLSDLVQYFSKAHQNYTEKKLSQSYNGRICKGI